VAGRAEDMLMLLWQRTDLSASGVRVDGDAAAVNALLHSQITL
jgi:hypothetical protein